MDNEKFLKEIGKRIIDRRKQERLTQEELAEKIDVSPQMISSAELGKKAIRPENLYKISMALGVSADYILTGEIIDKDIEYLQKKLQLLSSSKVRCIEDIIDSCIKLENNIKD